MLVIDPYQDRLLMANIAACRLLDYPERELLNIRASALCGQHMPALIVFTQEVSEKGTGWRDDIPLRARHGGQLEVEISAAAFVEEERTLLIFTVRDAAKIRRWREFNEANGFHRRGLAQWKTIEGVFQEIERENQLILRAAGEGIYGVNADGATTFVNPAAERMLGWRADELIGKNIHSAIHYSKDDGSHYHHRDCPIYAAFRDGEVRHVDDEVFWRKDGSAIAVEYTSTPIRDHGRLVGAVVVFRDISDRKRADARLRSALAEVEALRHRLEMENAYLQEEIRAEHNYKEIVGKSAAIMTLIHQIELVAPTDANVLISGESGTGKELIARAIHESSQRRDRPLIRVNCASIPRELFESEFFGHVKGAFTGAVADRAGRFALADGGTLFLDEVGEIPLELQSKLLRVLQEQQFERVGDSRTQRVNVRVIAATNRELKREVIEHRFREDLYFRLNVFPIDSVPLRERIEDVPLLASHYLKLACKKFNKAELKLSIADINRLQTYPWPGNIRELVNVIERAVILAQQGRLHFVLPDAPLRPAAPLRRDAAAQPAMPFIITDAERERRDLENIIAALRTTQGKIFGPGGASELLGVKPTTLASRIKRMGINKTVLWSSGASVETTQGREACAPVMTPPAPSND